MSDQEPEPDPDDSTADDASVGLARSELGEPDALFKVSRRWLRAKLYLGVGLIAYGVVANYLWWTFGPGRFGHVQFELLVLPPIVGVGLLVFMYRNRGLRVLVYPTGLLRLRADEVESYPWERVKELRLKCDPAGDPEFDTDAAGRLVGCRVPVKVPSVQMWNAWFELELDDGTQARFGPALADYAELAARVQDAVFAVRWPAAVEAVAGGGAVAFGDGLTATPAGLTAGKQSIPWADVGDVAVSGRTLAVKKKAGWLPFYAKDVAGVPNLPVLLGLARQMRPAVEVKADSPEPKE